MLLLLPVVCLCCMFAVCFQVLSVQTALSIQSHPDKKLAEKLHAQQPNVSGSAQQLWCWQQSHARLINTHELQYGHSQSAHVHSADASRPSSPGLQHCGRGCSAPDGCSLIDHLSLHRPTDSSTPLPQPLTSPTVLCHTHIYVNLSVSPSVLHA